MSNDPASDLSWLLESFVAETPSVTHAQTISSDGMYLAGSSGMSATQHDQFAAISSGLTSLGDSAREVFSMKPVIRMMIESASGWILLTRVSSLAALAIVTDETADLGMVGYELTVLVEKAGRHMSPEQIRAMQNALSLK